MMINAGRKRMASLIGFGSRFRSPFAPLPGVVVGRTRIRSPVVVKEDERAISMANAEIEQSKLMIGFGSRFRSPFAPLPSVVVRRTRIRPPVVVKEDERAIARAKWRAEIEQMKERSKLMKEREKAENEKIKERRKLKNEFLEKQMNERFEKFKEKEKAEDDSPDNTLFKLLVTISSNRFCLRLKKRCQNDEAFGLWLTDFVTKIQHRNAAFLLKAMGEETRYSIPKYYTPESASRAFARTLCPIVLFLVLFIIKLLWSMFLEGRKKEEEERELHKRLKLLVEEMKTKDDKE